MPVDNLDTRCREEHVGGAHPYKKNKFFWHKSRKKSHSNMGPVIIYSLLNNRSRKGVDNNPIITYKNIYNLTMKGIQLCNH